VARLWRKPAIFAGAGGIRVWRRHRVLHFLNAQLQVINRLGNQVAITVNTRLKFRAWDSYMQYLPIDVREACRLQPGLKALPIDLFFERAQDSNPLIQNRCWDRNK